MADLTDRPSPTTVREAGYAERYGAPAGARIREAARAHGCEPPPCRLLTDTPGRQSSAPISTTPSRPSGAPAQAVSASLGCGVPTAVADLHEGETVLDLGSGAGADVLISARRVGPTGRAIGLDMTDEMLALARANAAPRRRERRVRPGLHRGDPAPRRSVDVVISNCVINLAADKARVLREAARVLRPGGRFAVSDVIADEDMDDATRADMAQWTGCIAGALTRAEFEAALAAAGLVDVESARPIASTARRSAIVRARRP